MFHYKSCARVVTLPSARHCSHHPATNAIHSTIRTSVWIHGVGAIFFLALLYTVASLPEVRIASLRNGGPLYSAVAVNATCAELGANSTRELNATCAAPDPEPYGVHGLSWPIDAVLDVEAKLRAQTAKLRSSLPKLPQLRQTLTGLREEISRVGGASKRRLVKTHATVLAALGSVRSQMRQQLVSGAADGELGTQLAAIQQRAAEHLAALSDALLDAKGRLVARVESIPPPGRWPVIVYICAATMCMLCSSVYHLFMSMNAGTAKRLKGLDRASIAFLILGSYMPPIQFQLCDESWRTGTTVASAILFVASFSCAAFDLSNAVSVPIYLAQGALPVVIMSPVWESYGAGECSFMYRYIVRESCSQFDSLPLTYIPSRIPSYGAEYLYLSGAIYILGVGIYVTGYPETTLWQTSEACCDTCCVCPCRRRCSSSAHTITAQGEANEVGAAAMDAEGNGAESPRAMRLRVRRAKAARAAAAEVAASKAGRFDVFGSSHQLWHLCVLCAAIFHFVYTWKLFVFRQRNPCEKRV